MKLTGNNETDRTDALQARVNWVLGAGSYSDLPL